MVGAVGKSVKKQTDTHKFFKARPTNKYFYNRIILVPGKSKYYDTD
jgi:hypothetical protein